MLLALARAEDDGGDSDSAAKRVSTALEHTRALSDATNLRRTEADDSLAAANETLKAAQRRVREAEEAQEAAAKREEEGAYGGAEASEAAGEDGADGEEKEVVDPAVAAEELATAEQQMTAATAELEKVVAVQTSERKRLERVVLQGVHIGRGAGAEAKKLLDVSSGVLNDPTAMGQQGAALLIVQKTRSGLLAPAQALAELGAAMDNIDPPVDPATLAAAQAAAGGDDHGEGGDKGVSLDATLLEVVVDMGRVLLNLALRRCGEDEATIAAECIALAKRCCERAGSVKEVSCTLTGSRPPHPPHPPATTSNL